ncbi:MAG: hypothetical protein HGB12_09935 [Bacteroidetes bacterium]|nr:hypothetical protein [Bacteroidota bacterium]
MKKSIFTARFGTLCLIILSAGMLRLIHLPYNFAPIGAMALFGGAYFGKRWQSFLVPLAALFISDMVLNFVFYNQFILFHEMALWVYGAFALNVIIGSTLIKKVKVSSVATASIAAAILFFFITNFAVWAMPGIIHIYPATPAGLVACYVAAIPFFWGTLASNIFYSALLFGVFEFAQKKYPVLALKTI